MAFLFQNKLLEIFKVVLAVQLNIRFKLRWRKSKNLGFLNTGANIVRNIIIIFAKLSGILRVLILTIFLYFTWPEYIIQTR